MPTPSSNFLIAPTLISLIRSSGVDDRPFLGDLRVIKLKICDGTGRCLLVKIKHFQKMFSDCNKLGYKISLVLRVLCDAF